MAIGRDESKSCARMKRRKGHWACVGVNLNLESLFDSVSDDPSQSQSQSQSTLVTPSSPTIPIPIAIAVLPPTIAVLPMHWAPTITRVQKILLYVINRDSSFLPPQRKLLNNIDTVERLVMMELHNLKKTTPAAKMAEREKRVKILMSLR